MKKVAICISGQYRSFNLCLPSIFNNLILTNTEYELKFFTSFAKENDKLINIPSEFYNISSMIKIEEDCILPNLSYQKLKYKKEGFILNDERDPILIFRQLKQFQSVFNLVKEYEKDNNMMFDYVLRLRPDLEFKTIFRWELNDESIQVPSEDNFGGYNDRFAIGPRNLMDVYMNRLDYWMSENGDETFTTHNETNLKDHLTNNNIPITKIPIDLDYIRYNNYSNIKLKITKITNDCVYFINVTDEQLPLNIKICCSKNVIYSNKINISPQLEWYVGSPNKCDNKKVIFQGNDLYLEYKMN